VPTTCPLGICLGQACVHTDAALRDTTFRPDKPHGDFPLHIDVIQPLEGIRGVQKLRIDGTGKIFSDDILISRKGP